MKKFKALKAVYSYMYPEVRQAIYDTILPKRLIRFTWDDPPFMEFLNNFFQAPNDMDAMHEPVLQKWVDKHPCLKGLDDFKFRYPTAGSEEGIREFMTYVGNRGLWSINVLKGEYEGYKAVAATRASSSLSGNMRPIYTEEYTPREALRAKGKWFFISNPSARDGNIIPNSFIKKLCDRGNYIFYDLAYLDSTRYHEFDLSHPNIKAVVISASKPYGLFYWRWGALFSRDEEIPGLVGNMWFKVVPSILVMNRVLNTIDPLALYKKYRGIQQEIVTDLQKEYTLPFHCSDALLLSHIKDTALREYMDISQPGRLSRGGKERLRMITPFRRGDGYRFCLTPYFKERIG